SGRRAAPARSCDALTPAAAPKLHFRKFPAGLQFNLRMTASLAEIGSARLAHLAEHLDNVEGYADVVASLTAGHSAALGGAWGSSCALVAANLARHAPAALVVVCPRAGDVDDFCDDLAFFWPKSAESAFEKFPAWESAPGQLDIQDEAFGDRLRILK